MSVGLLAAQLQYYLYVFGHLSKWFVFVLMFKFWSVGRLCNGRPTIGYNLYINPINVMLFNYLLLDNRHRMRYTNVQFF